MIIDADCHLNPTPEVDGGILIDELIRRMDHAGVGKALTWLQPPYDRDVDRANEYVHRAAKAHPDRIVGFGWADPNLGVGKAKEAVRRCVEEYGFHGVKLNGAQNSFYIDDAKLSLPLVEDIARAGKPLALHVGADAYQRTHPFRVRKIAVGFPELPILAVHMGGASFEDLSNEMIEVAEECSNITLVGSAVRSRSILNAIRRLGASRVCFGSDTPFELMHVEVARYNALLDRLVQDGEATMEDKRKVMAGSIARFLGLREE